MQRREFEEDNFLKKLLKTNTNKNQINNTPIRFRDDGFTNKENSLILQNKARNDNFTHQQKEGWEGKENRGQTGTFYSNEIVSNNSKTVVRRRQPPNIKNCVNHSQTEAEFKIMIDNDVLNYCNKCAAHLASNGFQVDRIAPASKSPKRLNDQTNFHYPGQSQPRSPENQRKTELGTFIGSLLALQDNYKHKDEYLQRVSLSYEVEKETITNFYSSMMEYIEYIRDEHLKFIDDQTLRNTQICEIESAEIGETLQEISVIKNDIELNLQKILEEVDDENYNKCMSFYAQKYGLHQHRLEELGMQVKFANCTTAEYVDDKLEDFKSFFDELTGIKSSKIQSSASDY